MSEEQERRVPVPVVDRAALSGMASDAKNALAALRPGGKPPARRTVAGKETCEISVNLRVVTPILGGGPKLRDVDHVDIIRVPTVRGHLRFWWRALYGHLYESAEEFYRDESALWGRPADVEGGRSKVEVRVGNVSHYVIDTADIFISDSKKEGRKATLGAFALWPAQSQKEDKAKNKPKVEPAPRYKEGVTFALTAIGPAKCIIAKEEYEGEAVLKDVVRAWILFGGYGSRTRRGLGGLTVTAANQKDEGRERAKWLPALEVDDNPEAVRERISKCFSTSGVFRPSEQVPKKTNTLPQLAGAALLVPLPDPKDLDIEHVGELRAGDAWKTSLNWLLDFRQGTDSEGARKGTSFKPGVSNWPEADKIRLLTRNKNGHKPRHNDAPAFPRAGFGMPIVMKFKSGDGDPDGQFEILWKSVQGDHERLASPLILKALPLANGRFLPMALWLDRHNPSGSKVYVKGYENAAADFDVLVATEDKAQFSGEIASAMRSQSTLRGFFVAYLEGRGVQRIAP